MENRKSDEIEKLKEEINNLQNRLQNKNEIIERQEKKINKLSKDMSFLINIEKLLNISKAELSSAIAKIEISTNNAIHDFSNISGIFGETIKSTSDLVNSIKEKLNIVADKGNVAGTSDEIRTMDSNVIHDKYEAIINHILDEMTSIVKRKEEDTCLLDEVNAKVVTIKSFSSEIIKIARFSHILSINARIEAAQAGEWGKSFSVVATEISRLANETRAFSDKIDNGLQTTMSFIENSNKTLKKAIDVESSFINSTIFLMKDVFMSIVNGLISLINVIEKTVGESSDINKSIQNVIINLQFEDITKQIGTHVIQLLLKSIDIIQNYNNGNLIDSESGTCTPVESITGDIHQLFTMNTERIVADEVLAGNGHESTILKSKIEADTQEDSVTFF